VSPELKSALDTLEAARKRLMVQGKQGNGREAEYAEAYRRLCLVDPQSRPLRKKYR
jgi:hypothetical protein